MAFFCLQPMRGSFFFLITATVLVQATEWQTHKEIKTEVRKFIAESKQYDEKFNDLQYTAISVEEIFGDLFKVLKYCFKALKMDDSDDNVTIIELKENRAKKNGIHKYIPDIFTCLLNYESVNGKQDFHTENIHFTIRTIKIRHFFDFEMVFRAFRSVNDRHNHIQYHFINFMLSEIEIEIKAYTNKHLYVLITKHLLEKIQKDEILDAMKVVCDVEEYAQFRSKLFESTVKKEFFNLAVDKIYNIITCKEEELFEKAVDEVAEKILNSQANADHCNSQKQTIRAIIGELYVRDFKNFILNHLRIGLDTFFNHLQYFGIDFFNNAYRQYVSWFCGKDIVTEILPHQNMPEYFVEEYRISQGDSSLEIAAFIERSRIGSVDDINYSGNLLKLKNPFYTGGAKILLRGELTKDNIPTMCHILSHILKPIGLAYRQVICIYPSQSIDLNLILDNNMKIASKGIDETGCSIHVGFRILELNVLIKKKDQTEVYKSTITKNSSDKMTGTPDADPNVKHTHLTYDIKNLQKVELGNKRVEIAMHVKKSITDRLSAGNTVSFKKLHKTINISIKSNQQLLNLKIRTNKDDQCIMLVQKSYDISTEKPASMHIKYARKDYHLNYKLKSETMHSSRLVQYLKSIQVLSYISSLPELDCPKSDDHCVEFSIPVNDESPLKLCDLVYTNLNNIQKSIEDLYQKKVDCKTFTLEIQLADFLARKIYPGKWIGITAEFLRVSCTRPACLEKVLCRFIEDSNVFEASCENDVHGIDTSNYKILIVAKHIDDCKPVIFMMMRMLTCDFGYMSMEKY